jgi:aminomethyltransferase
MAEFAGYEMPIQYTSIVPEHIATRSAVSLFDISHMGRLRFEGPRAHELLDHLCTRRIENMDLGQVRYSLMCNEDGGILDDVLVSRLESPSSKQYFLMVVNAGNHEKIVRWIQPHLADFPDVEFHDVTEQTAMIAVQGPKAIETCTALLPPTALGLGYYRAVVTDQMKKPCIVSRTGYTGEDGLELIVRSEDAPRVWENLMLAGRAHGIVAAGLGARDTLRLEAAMPLYGHELSEEVDPIQAGLGFAVQTKGRSFIGSQVLTKRKAEKPSVVRVGIVLDGRRAARQGSAVLDADSRKIGEVTSGTFSPTLQKPISMAYISAEAAIPGSHVDVDIRGSKTSAKIVELPFYKRPE